MGDAIVETSVAETFPHYIEFRHVYKTFDKPVLVDSNFHVDAGQTVAIIGRSGVGKSVTLSHIMGFLKPDSGRVIVAHEDTRSWGYGAEIAARIGEELFHDLAAPVRRVAAMDTFVAYQPVLEDAILPQPEDLYRAMQELAAF